MKGTFDLKMCLITKIDSINILIIPMTFGSHSNFREWRGIMFT